MFMRGSRGRWVCLNFYLVSRELLIFLRMDLYILMGVVVWGLFGDGSFGNGFIFIRVGWIVDRNN
jgi:hypothetical protein